MKTLIVSLTFLLFSFSEVHAARYWADPEGSNTVPCLNISGTSEPGLRGSFARAVACATAIGDEVFVTPGIYSNNATVTNPASGITIRGSDPTPSNWPVLQPTGSNVRGIHFNKISRSNITVKFIKWDMTAAASAASCAGASSDAFVANFILEDFECLGPQVGKATDTGAAFAPSANTSGWTFRRGKIMRWHSADGSPGAHCFYWQGDNGVIEDVECSDVNGYGLQYYGRGVSPDNNIMRDSRFHDFKLRGPVYIQANSTGNQIEGNRLYNFNVRSRAVELRGTNSKVSNNTIYNAGGTGIRAACNSGCEAKNNIIYIPGGTPMTGSAGTTIEQNTTYAADPFVDASRGNLSLKTTSEPIAIELKVSKDTQVNEEEK